MHRPRLKITSGFRFLKRKSLVVLLSVILSVGIVSYLLAPAFGSSVEVLGGNGGMEETAQVTAWTLVNTTGNSTWDADNTVYYAGAGSGKLDSPEGSGINFNGYVYYRFTTAKVPESANLELAYKKLFTGAEPAAGNWDVAAEIWQVGGASPLQTIDIDTGTGSTDFTVLSNLVLTGITEIDTEYELRLVQKGQTGSDPAARLTTWFDEVKLNVTYDSTPPRPVSASAPTDRTVDVVFNEELDPISAESAENYSISPELNVTGAALQADGKTVRLTVEMQTRGTEYSVTANNIGDISGNVMVEAGTALFTGADTTPPAVVSAAPVTDKTVDVRFSEPVDASTAQTTGSYVITPELAVTEAVLQADGQTVRLTTATQNSGTVYTVTATGVRDLADNVIAGSSAADFTGIDSTPPHVVSAATVNDTTVSVLFNESVDEATAEIKANYSITPSLEVSGAVLQGDGKTVHLSTSPQSWQTEYTVRVTNVTDSSGNVIAGVSTATFAGLDTTGPEVVRATPVDDTTVDVVFNEPVDSASSQNIGNYSFSPALSVNCAVLQADGKTVRLETATQAYNVLYTVTVTGVADLAGNIIGNGHSASFNGADTTAPGVISASALNYRTVDVVFSEKVDPAAAEDVSNFFVTLGLEVTVASLQDDGVTVRLTTGAQAGGADYIVTVTGVKDIAGNVIGETTAAGFSGISPPSVAAPKVLSASAPNNMAVAVMFSTSMDPVTAQDTANYSISPALLVTGAVLQEDGVTVRLFTAEQTGGTLYIVTVSGVQDRYGNIIGDVDNTASFTGNEQPSANPHGRYLSDTNQCSVCHITHNAQGTGLLKRQTQTELCYLCHDAGGQSRYDVADQFGQTEPYAASHHNIPEGAQQCSDCHNPHDGGQDSDGNDIHWPRLLQSRADKTVNGGNGFCFSCHQTAQGNTRALDSALYPPDGTGHNNSSFRINGVAPMNPASGTNIRCMGCHEQHGSGQAELLRNDSGNDSTEITGNNKTQCFECHTGPSADGRYQGRVVYNNSVYNPHALTSSVNTNASYPGVDPAQAGQCINCHDPHGSANGTSRVLMKTLRGTYNDGKSEYGPGDFTFCFGCHNNTSANSKYDIQSEYNAPGGGHRISTGGNLIAGSQLSCETCHSLHGSANNNKYMLKDALGSNLGDGRNECLACHASGKTVEGIQMAPPPAGVPEHTGTSTPCLKCHGSPHLLTAP